MPSRLDLRFVHWRALFYATETLYNEDVNIAVRLRFGIDPRLLSSDEGLAGVRYVSAYRKGNQLSAVRSLFIAPRNWNVYLTRVILIDLSARHACLAQLEVEGKWVKTGESFLADFKIS